MLGIQDVEVGDFDGRRKDCTLHSSSASGHIIRVHGGLGLTVEEVGNDLFEEWNSRRTTHNFDIRNIRDLHATAVDQAL